MPTLHPAQSEIYKAICVDNDKRFFNVCTSRGFGKTHLCCAVLRTKAQELIEMDSKIPNRRLAVIMPTLEQGLKAYLPVLEGIFEINKLAVKRPSKSEPYYKLLNDVYIDFISWEAVERMRGFGYYFIVWDEVSSCTKGIDSRAAWDGIIYPCISTRWSPMHARKYSVNRAGGCLKVSTPRGYDFFYDDHQLPEIDDSCMSFVYDYTASPLLDPDEITRARATMDPIHFAREYLADFKETGNSVFYCFDRSVHVNKDIPDVQEGEIIHACIDFNVGIQATSFFVRRGSDIHFIDEFRGAPNTEQLADMIATRFQGHRIYAYPDPSGRSRKTSSPIGQTDFYILESRGIQCFARKSAPSIVDSVNAVNAKLKNAYGETHLFIHPRCTGLIQSIERTKWLENRPDSAIIDKSEGVEHFSDGIRYGIEYLFPVTPTTKTTIKGSRW